MAGRVLNFAEFSSKFSKDSEQNTAASFDTFSHSADNFKEGFDKETYGSPEPKPNRPISTSDEPTPPQPGEDGAPKFNSTSTDSTELEKAEEYAAETEKSEEDETPEPEMGANPKKKANESLESLLEMYDSCEECMDDSVLLDQEAEHGGPIVICSSCGTQKPMEADIPEEDPWFHQGIGMQCGCNM